MSVFINAGANKGDDIRNFVTLNEGFEIIAIECLPEAIIELEKLREEINFEIIPKAASTEDGEVIFHLGESTKSGSLMKEKRLRMDKLRRTISVEAFDFPTWLSDNFDSEDYVVLAMDIEGSEYDIIDRMFENGSIDLVDEFYLEFHLQQCKSKSITKGRQDKMLDDLIAKFGDKLYVLHHHQHEIFQSLNKV